MYTNRSRGFTLIELLVVIAIIGILSAVVLASLNTARNKGNDAAVQSDLSTVQTQAEIYYGGTGGNTYGSSSATLNCSAANTVFVDSIIARAITAADAANGSGSVYCNSTTQAYAIAAGLLNGVGGNMYWCVDSSGNAKSEAAALGSGVTACP